MNILIPDHWLREYLKTKATPGQIKEYLSLCGPSIERIYGTGDEAVYDVEVTGNRPDGMSVMGVAREAATILPRFGVAARLTGNPYQSNAVFPKTQNKLPLTIKTDSVLNPRWTSVIFDNVTIKPSPAWLTRYLTLAGIRSLNNVIDITNFLMR
ncbi:MAG: phenylalanine--tRNA ligase beta subunit-related protein, partial [Patescibacteria group bacterium]